MDSAVESAADFLAHPSVREADEERKRLFLREKGLADAQVDAAFRLAAQRAAAAPAETAQGGAHRLPLPPLPLAAAGGVLASAAGAASTAAAPRRRSPLLRVLLALLPPAALAAAAYFFYIKVILPARLEEREERRREAEASREAVAELSRDVAEATADLRRLRAETRRADELQTELSQLRTLLNSTAASSSSAACCGGATRSASMSASVDAASPSHAAASPAVDWRNKLREVRQAAERSDAKGKAEGDESAHHAPSSVSLTSPPHASSAVDSFASSASGPVGTSTPTTAGKPAAHILPKWQLAPLPDPTAGVSAADEDEDACETTTASVDVTPESSSMADAEFKTPAVGGGALPAQTPYVTPASSKMSFAEVMEMMKRGENPPGIAELPSPVPTNDVPPARGMRRPKPWEVGRGGGGAAEKENEALAAALARPLTERIEEA